MNNTENPNKLKNKKTKKVSLPIFIISLILALVIGSGASFLIIFKGSNTARISAKLHQVDKLVNNYYLNDMDYEKAETEAISGYLEGLSDKYSFYKSADEAKEISDSFIGETVGIGVTVAYDEKEGGLYIFRVDNNGPAKTAGIKEKDIIISVAGKKVKDIGYNKSLELLKGEVGKEINFTTIRDNTETEYNITIKDFVSQSVYYHKISDFGYIEITDFNNATSIQFEAAIKDLTSLNVKGIIFDVRNNYGGTVDSVNKMLDIILPACDLMTVEYKGGQKEVIYKSDENYVNLPFAVIVNGGSASASEMFAGSIKGMHKGILIGNTTYGKGVMQRTYFLNDKSCVRFTVGKFYPVGCDDFNEKGFSPDIEVNYTKYEKQNFYKLFDKDPYIIKAVEYLNEKTKVS